MKSKNESSSVGSDIVAIRKDYAAPTGLDFILVCGSTKMPRRWRSGEKRRRAAAVQDAGARNEGSRTTQSVWECASPLALGRARNKMALTGQGKLKL
ncbi:MAG: hypothetical protein WCS94_22055 [Verrucomicrobiota bacterium]